MKKQKISLYSGVFGGMVAETNQMIADAIEGMRAKEIEESTVTLRLSLSLVDKPVVQEDGSVRVAVVPVISYRLQNAMKYVVSSAAVVDTHGMELEQDTDGVYVFAPADGAQLSRDFDGDAEVDKDGNEDNGDPGEPDLDGTEAGAAGLYGAAQQGQLPVCQNRQNGRSGIVQSTESQGHSGAPLCIPPDLPV